MVRVPVILMILAEIPTSKGFQDTFHTASQVSVTILWT